MNLEVAQVLVRSLIGRLKLEERSWRLPEGRLSREEVSALELLSSSDAQAQTTGVIDTKGSTVSPASSDINTETTATRVRINLNALENDGPPENEIRLCIDFGTAMSKACATLATDTAVVPLRLDQAVGEGGAWRVPSSLYISDAARIYFGVAAERQHRSDMSNDVVRRRFDNIKWMLSEREPGSDLYQIILPKDIDPTGQLTYGDALLLYLAWLTDHACICLENERENREEVTFSGSARAIRRRFAIPCFESAEDTRVHGNQRAKWARSVIENAIAYAQVIADTLHGKWSELTVETALPVLANVRALVDIRRLKNILADRPDIREPIAAGASQFAEHVEQGNAVNQRRRLLVVDGGAGTTDFALFNVTTALSQDVGYSLVSSSVRMCREAGNSVDRILRNIIVKKCGIRRDLLSAQEYEYADIDLDSQIRDIKQQVFNYGRVDFNLRPGIDGGLERGEIEEHAEYRELGERLLELRDEIVRQAVLEKNQYPGAHTKQPIDVLLTGGSSALPVFRRLAEGVIEVQGWEIEFRSVDNEWIEYLASRHGEDIVEQYPQLAVAIGGAAPHCPEEIMDTSGVILPAPSGERWIPPVPRGQ